MRTHYKHKSVFTKSVIDEWITFSKSDGSCISSLAACTMSEMSLETLVISLDCVLSLLQSLLSMYSSQWSSKVCLNDGWTQPMVVC
jgi:hypothetical protein